MFKKLLAIMLCALCLAGCGGGSGGGSSSSSSSSSGGGDPKKEVQAMHDKYINSVEKTFIQFANEPKVDDRSVEFADQVNKYKMKFESINEEIENEKASQKSEAYKKTLKNYIENYVQMFNAAEKELRYILENKPESEQQVVREQAQQALNSIDQKYYEVENEYSKVIKGKPALVMGIEGVNYLAFSSSKVDIAITKVRKEEGAIGSNPFLQQEPMGKFLIVDVYMKNNQKDAITVDSNSFKLIDDEGREYSSSPEGQTALQIEQDSKAKGFLTRLNPNMGTSFSFVFDVPKELSTWDVKFEAKGGMTGKPTLMPLRPIKIEMVKD